MKTALLSGLVILASANLASAQVLAADDFSYADGALVPNGGWANHSGAVGDLLVAGGQVVVEHGVPSEDANLTFVSVAGSVYFGIDFSVDDLGHPYLGTDNEYFAHFREGFNFAGRLDVVEPTGAGDYSVGIASDDSTADAIWATDLTYGVTYRAVVGYDQVTNIATLWIDASLETDTSIVGDDQPDPGDTVVSVGLRQSDSSENETVRVDNLLVGQTFADVVGAGGATGIAYCFGDGTSSACPCGNNNDGSNGDAGCANGSSAGGASVTGAGVASVSADTVVLTTTGVQPNQPGLYFSALNQVNGGMGLTFGDGLRCAGGSVVRLGTIFSDGSGVAVSTPGVGAGLSAGDIRRYQYWYRNPTGSTCGAFFNLSNGYEINWGI